MFKKSLFILGLGAIVSLAIILTWAGLNLSTPEQALRQAHARLTAGDTLAAIRLLDLTEIDLRNSGDREGLNQLWRLRYQAYTRIQNPKGALEDINDLLQNGAKDDEELLLAQIRLFAADDQGERARKAARAFLEDHPTHSRGLELAGEACQTVYQPLLRSVRETIEGEIGRAERDRARTALLAFLYRPSGDPTIERARKLLEGMFTSEPRRIAMWPKVWGDMQQLRGKVQEALDYFSRSLDAGGEPVAAFRAIATALEQSGRINDLLMACEIQRRSFDHAYVDESGQIAAWARLRDGLPRAAIATVDRWLPQERINQLLADGAFSAIADDLLLVRAVAAWQLRDLKETRRTGQIIGQVRRDGGKIGMAGSLVGATSRLLRNDKDPEIIERTLTHVARRTLRTPPVVGRVDLAEVFLPVLLDFLRRRNAGADGILDLLQSWRTSRPETVEPLLTTADFLRDSGRTSAVFQVLDEAEELAPGDPRLFAIRLQTARVHFADTAQDGPGLLAQCARRRAPLPDVTDPVGYVLCAEASLALDRSLPVAVACARRAIEAFPNANLPRQLELRALLASEEFEAAARSADQVIRAVRPDRETLRLALAAKRAAQLPVRELVQRSLPVVNDSSTLAPELVQLALSDAPKTAYLFVTDEMQEPSAPVLSRALSIRAFAAADDVLRATLRLAQLTPGETPEEQRQVALAVTAWLAVAKDGALDSFLVEQFSLHYQRLQLVNATHQPLFAAAEELRESHPQTAYAVLTVALSNAPPEERTGRQQALAGELALALGMVGQCEQHWTAALAFADGHAVAEDLCRLQLVTDRAERAERVYRLVQTPTDGALAARFGRLDLAGGLIARQLREVPADLLTHATMATFGQPSMLDWQEAKDEVQKQRLSLLACLRNPAISALAGGLAQELVDSAPELVTNQLLLARTLVDASSPQVAAVLHNQAFQGGHRTPVLMREVAYAGTTQPGYVPGPALTDLVTVAVTTGKVPLGTSPEPDLTTTWGLAQFLGAFRKAGLEAHAVQVEMMQWQAAPRAMPLTPAAMQRVTDNLPPEKACVILNEALQSGHPLERRAVIDRFYELANQVLAPAATGQRELTARHIQQVALAVMALGQLQSDGALGPIVKFLVAHGDDGAIDKAALLEQHLERIAAGEDGTNYLVGCVEALWRQTSVEQAMTTIDALLERYPTAMPLWGERAKLRARLIDSQEALEELRVVLGHAPEPAATIAFVGLAGIERSLTREDIQQLKALPPTMLATPEAVFVRGLVALRQGRNEDAITLFEQAGPHYDGRQLYLLAQARLQGNKQEQIPQAQALLDELLRDYPNSSFARHAGSFSRQLSPHEAIASDIVENG